MRTTRFSPPRLLLLALTALSTLAGAAQPPAERRNFVACPILQDTDTVPCWLAQYGGETYFLGIQTDSGGWSPPWLGHRVLVEATLAKGPRICGGIPLTSEQIASSLPSGTADGEALPNPPPVSVMRELDPACNTILPADPRFHIVGRRGPGPNTAASALRKFPPPPAPPVVSAPYESRTFTLHYEFDSELATRTINEALKAVQYAEAIHAHRIAIVSHRGAVLLSDGSVLAEIPGIGRLRSEELVRTLARLGTPTSVGVETHWSDTIEPVDGITDAEGRRTELQVMP